METFLTMHFKFTEGQSPKEAAGKESTVEIPYASVVGSLMYVVTYTISNVASMW